MAEPTGRTTDAFLGGRLHLTQPAGGYRAGADAVFLAAATPAVSGESLLDLGCGIGTAALCAGRRVPGLRLTGLERQPDLAALTRENAAANGLGMAVVTGDLARMPAALRALRFDHVIANPPYFRRDASVPSDGAGREAAHGEDTPLSVWVDTAARRTRPGGHVTFIHRIERLPELLGAFAGALGSLEMKPLQPRPGREPQLFLLRGRKGGRAPFRLHPGLLVHRGRVHSGHPDYSDLAEAILRDAAPLDFLIGD